MLERAPIIICLAGDKGVGKSCIISRFCDNSYDEANHPTFMVDVKVRTPTINHHTSKLMIFDLSGNDRFTALYPQYYARAKIAMIAFDLTSRASWQSIQKTILQVRGAQPDIAIILTGTKSDLIDERVISRKEIDAFVASSDDVITQYIETSAKNNIGVDDLFSSVIKYSHQSELQQQTIIQLHSEEECRKTLMGRLARYIDEVTRNINYHFGIPDYSYNFLFMQSSRSLSRQVNFRLAQELYAELLANTKSIADIFNDVLTRRRHIASRFKVDMHPDYVDRDIGSDQLNAVVDIAEAYIGKELEAGDDESEYLMFRRY